MPLAKEKKRAISSLIITLGLIILFCLLSQIPGLKTIGETLELKTIDLRFVLEPRPPRSEKIVHIDLDDETIKKIGWPCPRKYYAYLIDILTEAGSQAIIFDIQFTEPSQPTIDRAISAELKEETKERLKEIEEDTSKISRRISEEGSLEKVPLYLDQLKKGTGEAISLILEKLDKDILDQDELVSQALSRSQNIFMPFVFPEESSGKIDSGEEALFMEKTSLPLIYSATRPEKNHFYEAAFLTLPIKNFARHITSTGFVNAGRPDRDGVMRRIPLLWEYKGKFFPQLALSSFLALTKNPDQRIEMLPGKLRLSGLRTIAEGQKSEIIIPVDEKMRMIIHWVDEWKNDFQHISFDGIVQLHEIRKALEEQLLYLDDKYTGGRWRELKTELASNPSPALQEELVRAEKDLFEFLERQCQKTKVEELKSDYDLITLLRQKESEIKDKIASLVKGKICLVGLTGTGTHDRRPIPLQPDYPMAGLHSNLLNTIFTQEFIRLASARLNLIVFLLSGLTIAILTPRFSAWKGMMASLILLFFFMAISQYLFQRHGLIINTVGPLGLIMASYTAITSYRYITEEKEKKWVRKAFSHYLSPRVMEEILADPSKLSLGGTRQELTVLFSDIRNFTNYCEKRSPEEIIPILNEYLEAMSKIIFKYNGTLDKYVGDEIVAFFGAPALEGPINHAEMAVRTSLAMVEELKILQEKWKREGKEPLDFGVGINTGLMVVGNMGSADRLNYTVIGDEVNLGARLEAQTRQFNVRIIISPSTYEKVKEMVEVKRLGEVTVKGKTKPVEIYELLSLKEEKSKNKTA